MFLKILNYFVSRVLSLAKFLTCHVIFITLMLIFRPRFRRKLTFVFWNILRFYRHFKSEDYSLRYHTNIIEERICNKHICRWIKKITSLLFSFIKDINFIFIFLVFWSFSPFYASSNQLKVSWMMVLLFSAWRYYYSTSLILSSRVSKGSQISWNNRHHSVNYFNLTNYMVFWTFNCYLIFIFFTHWNILR